MIVPRISGRTITSTLMRDAIAASVRSNRRRFYPFFSAMEPEALRENIRDFNDDIREVLGVNNRLMESDPARLYRNIFKSSGEYGVPLSTKLRMFNRAPLAALGIGPKSWRAAQLAPQRIGFSTEAMKGIAGMAVGSMLSPALDFVTKYVAPDPTDWLHVGGTVAKHAGSRAATGALIGFGTGTATTGVGGVPAAGAGILIGGFIGLVEGVFDAWSEVKEYELKTAEDLKRYND